MIIEINLNKKEYEYFSKKIREIVGYYTTFSNAGKKREIQELIDGRFTDNRGNGQIRLASEEATFN